jgi:predicted aspartyl protease
MTHRASRFAAIAAFACFVQGTPLAAQAEPDPTLPAGEIVSNEIDRYERMTVPVTIAGQGPFRFMIDTGAQATVVTPALRDRLQMPTLGRATLVGMAAAREVELVQLDGLEFAARVFDAIHAPLLDAQNIGADGILGLDSLQNLRVLIDFRSRSIAVNDGAALGGNRGYEIIVRARRKLGRLIITSATVDGVKTAVIIDTGAQGSVANRALQRRLRSRHEQEVTTTDVNGVNLIASLGRPRTVEIDRMKLANVSVAFADAPAFAALGLAEKPAMVLGISDLRLFDRIAIDFAQRTVLFDLPKSAVSPR